MGAATRSHSVVVVEHCTAMQLDGRSHRRRLNVQYLRQLSITTQFWWLSIARRRSSMGDRIAGA
eukprot:NODE_13897_length_1140_cov_5.885489.p3 GENE.NODE_13897_length_1140_cov_5.885489~~NODE_13897_length_1140_cov_5.885489.p3  ORF type:complete len:64 (-),score=9.57 NODE_13897_length_1140_cov_5.885489:748-939(-)